MRKLKLSILGDSISAFEGQYHLGYSAFYEGTNRLRAQLDSIDDIWWGRVIKALDMDVLTVNAWSGSFVSRTLVAPDESCGCDDRRTGYLGSALEDPDIIIVFMGTNDYGLGIPMKSEDKRDLFVFENAYDHMLDSIKSNYPESDVYCCTMCKHRETNGMTEKQKYCDIITSSALAHFFGVIDIYRSGRLITTCDGLHPDRDGMITISDIVTDVLEQKYKN